jgi:hypothetical protein
MKHEFIEHEFIEHEFIEHLIKILY